MKNMQGVMLASSAYAILGLVPLLWVAIMARGFGDLELLSVRTISAATLMLLVVLITGKAAELRESLLTKWRWYPASATMLAVNYGLFIFAVTHGMVFQASLGLLMGPIVHLVVDKYWFNSQIRRNQYISVLVSIFGVAVMTSPSIWMSLALALTWTLAQAFRKAGDLKPISGFTCETITLIPLAILYLSFNHSGVAVNGALPLSVIVIASGIANALPLVLLIAANRRLSFTAMGWAGYIAPAGQTALALFVYHEHESASRLAGYALLAVAAVVAGWPKKRAERTS